MMGIKKHFDNTEMFLKRYRNLIGVCVLIMLVVLSILTYNFFDKQNQIIETGGFIDGKIKCVCDQGAWDLFIDAKSGKLNLSGNVIIEHG